MNEKRFTQKDEDDWEILEHGEHLAFAHSGYNAQKIIERLNDLDSFREGYFDLQKQIKQLRDENHRLMLVRIHADDLHRDVEWLKENLGKDLNRILQENTNLKQSPTMYYNLFKELQRQMQGVKGISDLDSKDFEDLIELSKGNVFTDEIGWVHFPIKELQE